MDRDPRRDSSLLAADREEGVADGWAGSHSGHAEEGYADDVELRAAATQLWNEMSETNLIGKAIWNIRTKALLGVIG